MVELKDYRRLSPFESVNGKGKVTVVKVSARLGVFETLV